MFSLKSEAERQPLVETILSHITSSTESKTRLRLKILVSLFNMLVSSTSKNNVLIGKYLHLYYLRRIFMLYIFICFVDSLFYFDSLVEVCDRDRSGVSRSEVPRAG